MFDSSNAPALVLVAVLILIAIRQVGGLRLQIWQIMLFGAGLVLITAPRTWISSCS